MSYGLDFSDVRYETDHAGNRLKATIPYTMFSALTEFWIAARRAQTAQLEATARPGQYKGSLQAAQLPTPDEPSTPAPPERSRPVNRNDRHWQNLVAHLPPELPAADSVNGIAAASPAAPITEPIAPPPAAPRPQRVFYREFVEAPPAEVMERIASGVYFTRAWREYRGLTLGDAAELYGRDKTTIIWHESGKTPPSKPTLEKFAQIYDCPLAQLTLLPGSDTSAFVKPAKAPVVAKAPRAAKQEPDQDVARRHYAEPRSPADTDYPDAVLAHLMAGKSPMLAWRLYRRMDLKALADAYATTTSNVKAMEANSWLRPKTIEKLCPIFHCKPEQMLRSEGMPSERDAVHAQAEAIAAQSEPAPVSVPKPKKARAAPAASTMETAFMQARVVEERAPRPVKERDRVRDDRLAKMQREMANL